MIVNPRIYAASTVRILRQLRTDRRTVAMILFVPSLIMVLLYFLYQNVPTPPGQTPLFDRIAITMLGIIPFIVMFLVTSIAMQRERSSGTLERLLTTPLSKLDLLMPATGQPSRSPRRHRPRWRAECVLGS